MSFITGSSTVAYPTSIEIPDIGDQATAESIYDVAQPLADRTMVLSGSIGIFGHVYRNGGALQSIRDNGVVTAYTGSVSVGSSYGVTPSANCSLTVGSKGTYEVQANVTIAMSGTAAWGGNLLFMKNGLTSSTQFTDPAFAGSSWARAIQLNGHDFFHCNAGDVLQVALNNDTSLQPPGSVRLSFSAKKV